MTIFRFKRLISIALVLALAISFAAFALGNASEWGEPGGGYATGDDYGEPEQDSEPNQVATPNGFGIMAAAEAFGLRAVETSSNLRDFVASVVITDQAGNVINDSSDTVYIGQTYKFTIKFAETPNLQLAYNPAGFLTYQLPVPPLFIPNPIGDQPIRIANGNIVGWYSIGINGAVLVRFGNYNQNGQPSETNYIDLTNVTLTLEIFAQLTAGGGGDIDFGIGDVVTIPDPVLPPPSLDVVKTSQYNPETETINYMITITALGGQPVTNITFVDNPEINGLSIFDNPTVLTGSNRTTAFYGFTYDIDGGLRAMMPLDVARLSTPANWQTTPIVFSHNFGSELTLNPGQFITIRYHLDVQQLIANNPGLNFDPLDYSFNITNSVVVHSPGLPDTGDSTSDLVNKDFSITKDGVFNDIGTDRWIDWTVEIGDGVSTMLNSGTITETLGTGLFLPARGDIEFVLYTRSAGEPIVPQERLRVNASQIPATFYTESALRNEFVFRVPTASDTTLASGSALGNIYRIDILFRTDVTIPPPHAGMPPINYTNKVTFDPGTGGGGFGTTDVVPIKPPTTGIISKTTSGICGNPTSGYWVDYTITINVPTGLSGEPLYLFDNLGFFGNGSGVPNVPQNLLISGRLTDTGASLPVPLLYTAPIPYYTNGWRVFFGTTIDPDKGGMASWQYQQAVTLVITYRINLDYSTINLLKGNSSGRLQNSSYLINSLSTSPIVGGDGVTSVAGVSINDYWPIHKSSAPTENPGLYSYTVRINGGFSARPDPLFRPDSNPRFSDTFDSNLQYVPRSFYIINTNNGQIFAPPGDLTVTGNSFEVILSQLHRFNTPPQQGGTSQGLAAANWYSAKNVFEVRYQLLHPPTEDAFPAMRNVATITVNTNEPGHCVFDSDSTVNYVPRPLNKTMNLTGTDLVNVQIIINADGGTMFAPIGSPVGPPVVTAKDELTNLSIYLDTLRIFTQTNVGGVWDGVWITQPFSINGGEGVWSVNVITQQEIDFVIPNQQPVKIAYDALVLFDQNTSGEIRNRVSIFGEMDDAGDNNYTVGSSTAGAGGSRQDVRIIKRDPIHNLNLRGAQFDLYVVNLAGRVPPAGLPTELTIGNLNFGRLITGVQTDINGIAVLSDPWIVATYRFLYLLVETESPVDYILPDPPDSYTFFTVNPRILSPEIASLESVVGRPINQISDFIQVENTPNPTTPSSLIVRKSFPGLSSELVQQHLQSFRLVITDPLGRQHSFGLAQALEPRGIVIENMVEGTYFIQEYNFDVPGYVLRTRPQMPLRMYLTPNTTRAIVLLIDNIYEPLPKLTISKTFSPPHLEGIVSKISFLIIGTDDSGREIYRNTVFYRDFVNGRITLDQLPPGNYVVHETGGYVEGYLALGRMPMVFRLALGDDITLNVRNTYVQGPPPEHPGLRVRKAFHGLPAEDRPDNFQIKITNPDGRITYHTLNDSNYFLLEDAPPGTYFIDEVGYNVDGFAVETHPDLPIRVVVLPREEAIVIELAVIDNIYTPLPPSGGVVPPIAIVPPWPDGPPPPIPITPVVPPYSSDPYTPVPPYPVTPTYPARPTVPATPADPTDPASPADPSQPPDGTGSPQTGDAGIGLYVALLIIGLCLAAVSTTLLYKRKK
ncbi:MAG: hypothetical protein FWB97_04645 [Oscillospiraceae bacterium]|nr:hypothetical protein [Oscillospiraceae bacterium]